MKRFKSFTAWIIAATLAVSLVACENASQTNTQNSLDFTGYPIDTDVTLEYWVSRDPSEYPFGQQLTKETGIKVKYLTPPAGQAEEQFNIMLASGALPDIMQYKWLKFPGGPDKAISDGHIIALNEVFEKYSPNLKKYIDDNQDIAKMMRTDNGSFYVYPFIYGDELLYTSMGPVVRKDWLDELGMSVPETIDDWYTMLSAFKGKKNLSAPLVYAYNVDDAFGFFSGAFGVKKDFYLDGEAVKYGPMEPGYKEYLQTLAKWYEEGLLDSNFAATDYTMVSSAMINETAGATVTYGGSGIGAYMKAKESEPSYQIVPAPYPVKNKGDIPIFGLKDFPYVGAANANAAITSECKNVELAARLLDYFYSEAGNLLCNFGIEGESYTMIDGYPTYTDLVLSNPEKPMSTVLAEYGAGATFPFIRDKRYIEQYYQLPQQQDALTVWQSQAQKTNMPPVTLTQEESSETANILNSVTTYVDENSVKFIMGIQSFDNYDKFLNDIKSMGIEKAVSHYDAAYKRYQSR